MQKYVNPVDLVKSFPTSIYLQKSASIQPRTSSSKFGGKYSILFNRVLNRLRKADASVELHRLLDSTATGIDGLLQEESGIDGLLQEDVSSADLRKADSQVESSSSR